MEREAFSEWNGSGLEPRGVLLGKRLDPAAARPVGFLNFPLCEPSPAESLLRLARPGHGMVVAGTGEGKFVNVVGPNVLVHEGPLVVVDPKGEIAAVTARRRRSLGPVFILDPFEVLSPTSDSYNPLDLMFLPGMAAEDGADTMAWDLSAGHESVKDPFWQNTATSLVSGLIASAIHDPDPSRRNLETVVDDLFREDVIYSLACKLDQNAAHGAFARQKIAEFLQIPDNSSGATRGCVLTSAQQYLHCFHPERIRRCVRSSSLPIRTLFEGEEPLTIYLVFPPMRSKSHRGLLRLWLASLLQALMIRPAMPSAETLVIIDEAANLGPLDLLPLMHSYARSTGTSLLTAWQSFGQISDLYGHQARTLCENCAVILTFGLHSTAVDAAGETLGVSPKTLRDLRPDQLLAVMGSIAPRVLGRIDYRFHPILARWADANPRYGNRER